MKNSTINANAISRDSKTAAMGTVADLINGATIFAKGDFFIVPNSFGKIDREYQTDYQIQEIKDLYEWNGITDVAEDDMRVVQIWITSTFDGCNKITANCGNFDFRSSKSSLNIGKLGTENLGDHGFVLHLFNEERNETYRIGFGTSVSSFIPYETVKDVTEYTTCHAKYRFDVLDITVTDKDGNREVVYDICDKDCKNRGWYANFELDLTARQREYRYRNFGTFEEVLAKLNK